MQESEFIEELKKFEPIIKFKAKKVKIAGLEYQDIQQEIRIRLWKKYPSFKGESSFKTWANRVAENCIKNLIRDSRTKKASYLNEAENIDNLDNE
jgi:RNA polymerase sigma-70 factor (ECF subfamily)